MARTVLGHSSDTQFTTNTFLFGIYNQLADDFSDFFSDFAQQAVTPYTYYFTYRNTRNDLINPFELFWTVTATLIYDVYQSDAKTRDIILTRAINSLKRFKEKWGTEKFMDMMEIFSISNRQLQQTIQKVVHSAPEMEFLDKLLRDQMIYNLNEAELERKAFKETIEVVRARINKILPIIPEKEQVIQNDVIIEASNYSLQGEAKRLRPIISWFIGVNMYKLNEMSLEPLLKSLEYMHTASLIFDDLPAQDNASLRRGRKTVHQMYNTAIAELTGLFLSQKAIEEQTSLPFDTKRVLQVIQYSAKMTMEMCKGQMMDLQSDGRKLTLEQLKQLSVFKTGLGFEAALLLPAILAGATEAEKNELRQFAKHAGIAFQIKDDLLDVEGESSLLGKEVGMDQFNQKATYVSVLGVEGAKQQMWEHYCQALDCLQKIGQQSFLKQMLEYIVTRSR